MRLVCRECSAAYEAPDSLFGSQPRAVRCNRCGYQWDVVKPAVPSDTAPMPMPIPAPVAAAPLPTSPMPAAGPSAAVILPEDSLQFVAGHAPRPAPASTPAPAPTPAPAVFPERADEADAESSRSTTRTLLADLAPEPDEMERPDAEERRLSHELSFGETEFRPTTGKPRRRWRGLTLAILILAVLVIAAILFEPQLISAFPVLDGVYAAVGL